MKKILGLFLMLCAITTIAAELQPKKLKVLMLGNSFSVCVGNFLPSMVNSVDGLELELTSLYIGGCSLQRHWEEHLKTLEDSNHKPYRLQTWDSTNLDKKINKKSNLSEALKSNSYDIVTIQQASPSSPFYETYQPYADNLISYIKANNPNAEIVIQETWSYRADDPRFKPTAEWKFDNNGMYDKLHKAYSTLAKKYNFRVIPTGTAVQFSRQLNPIKFVVPTSEELASYNYPDLPPQAGDVVGAFRWDKNKETGKITIGADRIHFNGQGHYLQASVWFAILFGRSTTEIKYNSPNLDNEYCKFLRECAQKAADEYKQVKNY